MNNEMIIYATEDGKANVHLFAKDGNIWMNQKQMAELFETSVPNINMHISNVLKDKELDKESVIKYYLITATDGKQYEAIQADKIDDDELKLLDKKIKSRKKNTKPCKVPPIPSAPE